MYDKIYQAAFEDELEKIAGIPRFGLMKRVYNFGNNIFNKEHRTNEAKQFRKTKLYKHWNRKRKKELRLLKKHWRKRRKLKV